MAAASTADFYRFGAVLTTAQLTAAGQSPIRVRSLVERGVLTALGRGVYVRTKLVGQAASDPAARHALKVAAVLARTGPDTVASHHSAAVIHRLDLISKPDAEVSLSRPPGNGSRKGSRRVRMHVAQLLPGHVIAAGGLRVTSVPRTVVDLARALPFREGVVVADCALRERLTSKPELSAVVAACGRWPGIERARGVVAFSDDRAESPLESISRVAFDECGLPPPDLQVWVGGDGMVIGRVDFLWQPHRTVGEADGLVKYADPPRAIAQLQRDARLREAGFEVVHFTWWEITHAPDQVAASIRMAFRRGAAGQ